MKPLIVISSLGYAEGPRPKLLLLKLIGNFIFPHRSGAPLKNLCNRHIFPPCPQLLPSFRRPASLENILFFALFINYDKTGTLALGQTQKNKADLGGVWSGASAGKKPYLF
jgi:hypothetical protein